MGKPKRSGASSGLRKSHGPKRHMFKELKPMIHEFAKYGVLDKYSSEESWILSCQARNKNIKTPSHDDWNAFKILKTKADKDAWFKAYAERK